MSNLQPDNFSAESSFQSGISRVTTLPTAVPSLSNSDVLELYRKDRKECTLKLWQRQMTDKMSQVVSRKSIDWSVKNLKKEYEKRNKSKNKPGGQENLSSFLQMAYEYPHKRTTTNSTGSSQAHMQNEDRMANVYRTVALDLASENNIKAQDLIEANQQTRVLEKEIADLRVQSKRLDTQNKSLQRQDRKQKATIDKAEKNLKVINANMKEQKVIMKALSQKENVAKEKLKTNREELKRTASREKYYTAKCAKLETSENKNDEDENNEDEIIQLRLQLDSQNKEIAMLTEENQYLNDLVTELKSDTSLLKTVSDDGIYIPEFRALIYDLLNLKVSQSHVSPVIEAVAGFCRKQVQQLPKPSTVNKMNIERLALSQTHLAEELPKKTNLTTYSDETMKFSEKYMAYQISDSDRRMWTVGMRDIATKSAEDALKAFKEVLHDIEDRAEETGSQVANQILANIQNKVSDRAATEKKFTQILETTRKEILPEVIDNWAELEEKDKEAIINLSSYFCGLHSMVQAAQVTSDALSCLEEQQLPLGAEKSNPHERRNGEPAVIRVERTAAKLFARGGDEKCGCHGDFTVFIQDFLKENGMRSVPIQRHRSSRFNIIYLNAAFDFWLHTQMVSFLEGQPTLNLLQKSCLADLKEPFILAGLKALGLISKLITGPLWRLVENKDIHVLDMDYSGLVSYIDDARLNLEEFISGKLVWENGGNVHTDHIYTYLTQGSPYDDDVIIILEVVLPALSKLFRSHYEDIIMGNPDDTTRERTQSVIKHNKGAETIFGIFDQMLRHQPHVSHIAAEAHLMFCLNRTDKWLRSKSEKERAKLINKSRKDASEIIVKYKERKDEIRKTRKESLEAKRKEAEQAKLRKLREKEKVTEDIIFWGLWQTPQDVEAGLEGLQNKKQEIALKAQLRFRQKILEQDASKELFVFSRSTENGKRQQLTVDDLKQNVLGLITHAYGRSDDSAPGAPHFIIGKRVSHLFKQDGKDVWYEGRVVSTVPGYSQWFNIVYEEEPGIVYTWQLLKDLENGDLKVLTT